MLASNQFTPSQQASDFSSEVLEKLSAPLNAEFIKDRQGGGGRRLKYITGKTAIDAANRIFGYGQWGYRVVARSREQCADEKKGTIEYYTADVELSVAGSAFSFPGDGVGIVTAPYTVEMHEKARKESVTDALKRALRHYGDQFGLALYDEDSYVEDHGVMVQVKEVKPNQNKAPKRVIDAPQPVKRLAPVVASTPARSTDEKPENPVQEEQYIPTETELKTAMQEAGYTSVNSAISDLCVGTGKSARGIIEIVNANGFTPDIAQFLYNRIQLKKQEQQ